MDDYEDDHALFGDEGYGSADQPGFEPMEGPGLFDEPGDPGEAAEPEPDPVPPQPDAQPGAPMPSTAEVAPLALYRRYRPDTFAEVIGQEHVTDPLQRALTNNRVNHAYLFSGPRGCGKTTSARILARCLNCDQGPTATPCGVCRSCTDLARGGPGSIDVIEIDAASHGGVDDARELRERAYFAPVSSRYKIYIVDEAHMVTTAGFNALLKLVEEPPPHAKFVFATTEPDKVIGTIRSRTHHYPFRLVPPRVLGGYLTRICESEGVSIDHAAIPLVVRAGAGSVRDCLSVLDQLLGGAGEEGVGYAQAAALLGYTPEALLDEIVDAFAAGDAAGVFRAVDKVIEAGQDPRRFAEDLLRRLRDLVILAAVPEAAVNGLLDVAADQAQRLQTQVAGMGPGELTRAAEVIASGLTEMRGTTAPRLHLELMCSRVLLPGADAGERGLHARMDRLERRVGMMGSGQAVSPEQQQRSSAAPPSSQEEQPQNRGHESLPPAGEALSEARQGHGARPTQPNAEEQRGAAASPEQPPAPRQRPAGAPPRQRPAGAPPRDDTAPGPEHAPAASRQQAQTSRQLTAAELRRAWPQVLEEVKRRRRFTYMLLSQHAQVVDVADGVLTLGFAATGPRDNFGSGGSAEILSGAIIESIGVELRIDPVVTGGGVEAQQPRQRPSGAPAAAASPVAPSPPEPDPDPEVSADDEVLDAAHNAEELLTSAFEAQVIAVRDVDEG